MMNPYTTVLLFSLLFINQLSGQGSLKWVVEGSLHNASSTGGTTYSFKKTTINNVNYTEGTDPFLWGYLITTTSAGISDTIDFEVLVESSHVSGSGHLQLTIYNADSTMDLQTHFSPMPLNQFIRLKFNIFKYGSRVNTAYAPGTGGIPRKASIGFSGPNSNPTSVGRLHAAEVYYIEDPLLNNSIPCVVVDPCNQVDTAVLGQMHSNFNTGMEDLDKISLHHAKLNNTYPYNATTGRTYIHVMEKNNTCDHNNNNRLEASEASYNVYFPAMSSFIVGRQDILKEKSNSTGQKSAMGFSLSSSFNPSILLPTELSHWTANLEDKNSAQLNWSTASETNNAYFEIEHALPTSGAPDFNSVETIEGAGTTTTTQYYDYKVYHLTRGVHYFRLKQVDFDGKITYSPIKAITIKEVENPIAVYPTFLSTTSSSLFIKVNTEASYQVKVYNMMGAVVELFTHDFHSNQYTEVKLDLSKYDGGIYFVQVMNKEEGFTQKIRIQ